MTAGRVSDRLRLVSHFPGRLRVRAEMFRAMPDVADEVVARLNEEPAVTGTQRSPITGSILVTYDPAALQLPKLVQIIVRTGGLGARVRRVERLDDAAAGGGPHPRRGRRLQRAHARGDGRHAWTAAWRIPASLLAGGLALLFVRPMLPNWWDLTFWAYTTFHNLNPDRATRAPAREPDDGSADEA